MSAFASLLEPATCTPRRDRQPPQARSAPDGAEPGHVHRRDREHPRHGHRNRRSERVRLVDRDLALVHRPLRELRRSVGRGSGQGAGGGAAQDPRRDDCSPSPARRHGRGGPLEPAGRRGHRRRLGRRADPGRRRGDRRDRERRRVGDHRRVGAGDPRVGRRPLRGHGRHARALGRDRRQGDAEAGRELPRPHDRARRGLVAPEDAERDRARHPPRRADRDLPARGRDAAAVRDLLGRPAGHDRPRRAARVPDPDDDRRAAVGDRDRGNGPARAPQRARALRACRRSGGRLLDAPARQDGHDHPRQPPGGGVPAAAGRARAGARRRRPAREPRRRDPRGPLDRRPRQGALPDPRARARGCDADPVHGTDADERRRHARARDPEGRCGRGQALGRCRRRQRRPRSRRSSITSRSAAGHRSSWPRTGTRSGSSS